MQRIQALVAAARTPGRKYDAAPREGAAYYVP
jgi:hypothetical protein